MHTSRFIAAALVLAACAPRTAPPATTAAAPSAANASRGAPQLDRFEAEIARFEESDRGAPPTRGGILFVGSSSIRLWPSLASDFPGLPVLNRGFGGSTILEVNHYVPRIVLPYRPRMIVLYAGDNEIAAGRAPEQVADDYRTFVGLVRPSLPSTRIVFISVKPSPSRWAFNSQVRETNRLVRAMMATDPLQSFVDVFTPMLGADGHPRAELFVADSLHMTPQGYAVWRNRLTSIVR
ncbi:MAG: hypothetical protein JWL95_1599 [Gemmatimonadetes bacterium]|nr:hypothetical protein [Gemmatimonadota bacterium]